MATLTDKGIKDGSIIGNPNAGDYFRFMDSNNSNLLTIRDSSGTDSVYGTGGGLDELGWILIEDNTFTSGAPFTILSGVDKALQFNIDADNDTYKPNGYVTTDFFDDTNYRVKSPVLGASYMYRLRFNCKPSANTKVLNVSYSIGASVASQIVITKYQQDLRTSGVATPIDHSGLIYSLSTFLTNGMQIILNANTDCDIYDISMVISRIN